MRNPATSIRKITRKSGFALIIVLLIMVLLTIIALGLLSLSSIELRTGGQATDMANARANARLGLILAIGDIQKELGPDQKITAVSEILNPNDVASSKLNHTHLTGVWNSRQEVLGTTPDYTTSRSFVKWLVSSSAPTDLTSTGFAQTGTFANEVVMANARGTGLGGTKTTAGNVSVPASKSGNSGGYAWWVSDENCKGFTSPVDSFSAAGQSAVATPDLLARAGVPGAYAMQISDKTYPANTPTSAKVISNGELALASTTGMTTQEWFHDLSPHASGLLTNVVKGGLRQDLNLYLEQPRPADPWPWAAAGSEPSVTGPNGKYALSEVNDYDVVGWKYLYNFYHLKERVIMQNGRPMLNMFSGSTNVTQDDLVNPRWNAGVLRPTPVLVRALVFISFGSIPNPANPTQYVLRFYAAPVITLWNPYNVDLQLTNRELNYLFTSLPIGHKLYVNGQFKENFAWRGTNAGSAGDGANNYNGAGLQPILNKPLILQAGEARMLTATGCSRGTVHIHQIHNMEDTAFVYSQSSPGGLWGGGIAGGKVDDQQIVATVGTATDKVMIDTHVNMWDQDGGSFNRNYLSTFDIRGEHAGDNDGNYTTFEWGQKAGWLYESTVPDIATPDKLTRGNKPTATFGEILNAPRPLMVVDMQLKALDEVDLPNKTWRDCIPSHPYQGVTMLHTDATPYFANPFKIRFDKINSYQEASSYLQIAPDNPVHTYFGGSYLPSGGVSYITDREIPLAPFTSLAQLQHLPQQSVDNLYSSGVFFQNRAIGNSFASPGVPSDKVKVDGWPFNVDSYMNTSGGTIDGVKFASNALLQRPNIDRSYAANNLLWDDYFFSSMAAKNDVLRSGSAKQTLDVIVKGFYESNKPLPNERYRPYLGSRTAAAAEALLVRGTAAISTAYSKVGGLLTVDGSFNINSVSVPAWKTMIAAANKKNMVILEPGSSKPTANGAGNYVVSRFSMPNAGSVNKTASAAANLKWQGYHELTETQIGELAEAMVQQVKLRGPFRSLAEFVNRRLGPESDDRTKYGAIQAALEDPKVSINDAYRSQVIVAADIKDATSYQNKTAALGPRYQGSPPCVTQADLLNTIGPVLSARSDSFLVRAYGESRDAKGNVTARAWCEAILQRSPDFVDPKDAAETPQASLQSAVNKQFGRRFAVAGFRWLSPTEL